MSGHLAERINKAKELLSNVRHASMATVNEDGSPLATPYLFMCDEKIENLYWGSHPESQHSKNVARTGQIFVVLYEANDFGGLYIEAEKAHALKGEELKAALAIHNKLRMSQGKESLTLSYYEGKSPQRMYGAKAIKFWVNMTERDKRGMLVKDYRQEINRTDLFI